MEMVGVQMIVAKATGSLTMLGYFAAAQLLPILLLGIFGGLVADRVNRKKLLVWTQAMLMVIAAAVAAAAYWQADLPRVSWVGHLGEASGLVAALFILSVMQGVVMAFNIPAWQVLTPRLVPRDELTKAINLNGISFNGARVVGPGAGGRDSGVDRRHAAVRGEHADVPGRADRDQHDAGCARAQARGHTPVAAGARGRGVHLPAEGPAGGVHGDGADEPLGRAADADDAAVRDRCVRDQGCAGRTASRAR